MDQTAELRELREQIGSLVDRNAIEDLLSEFAAAMDGQDADRIPDLFTPDIVIEHPGGGATGRDEVVTQLTQAISHHFTSHHMITNHRGTVTGDRAWAVAYFHSVHLDDPGQPDQHEDHGGWYLLELARTNQGWKIDRLKQVSVWSAANRRPKGPLVASMLDELRRHLRRSAEIDESYQNGLH
ncbi:MAG: nuclear transport factor 2 family protein [Acidimicrobiales bacterium]